MINTVLVTGSCSGMGKAITLEFLNHGHLVVGIDRLGCPKDLEEYTNYNHFVADVADPSSLPSIERVEILINNAGVQGTDSDIDVNLKGVINCTEKYALNNPYITAVLNQASAAAHLGNDFPQYVASKGGVIAYTKWTAKEIAKYGATCNSISLGGVVTLSNGPVIYSEELWQQVMDLTPLHKWCSEDEVAKWVYFLTTVNKSASGQDFVIDNLESLNGRFVWNN